jgi:hypothetical protein
MRAMNFAVLLAAIWLPLVGHGEETAQQSESKQQEAVSPVALLSSDQPNRWGCTRDSYEHGCFMDFTVSLRYPLFYEALQQGHKFDMLPFFSFTARMGQYSGSVRHSSRSEEHTSELQSR